MSEESDPQIVQDINPGVAEKLAEIMRGLMKDLSALNATFDVTHTSLISYMDRVILLSAGSLTLIFTVLGGLSAHLSQAHPKAAHIPFVLIACWLLVTTIITGLGYKLAAINLMHVSGIESVLSSADAQFKLALLSIPHVNDVSKIPSIGTLVTRKVTAAPLRKLVAVLGLCANLSLTLAFLFLTLFIQANIVSMLDTPPQQPISYRDGQKSLQLHPEKSGPSNPSVFTTPSL